VLSAGVHAILLPKVGLEMDNCKETKIRMEKAFKGIELSCNRQLDSGNLLIQVAFKNHAERFDRTPDQCKRFDWQDYLANDIAAWLSELK